MELNNLTNEQVERLKSCKSGQDFMNFLADEGVELNDEQLECVTGGLAGLPIEDFLASFGNLFRSIFPQDFDPANIWNGLPLGGPH